MQKRASPFPQATRMVLVPRVPGRFVLCPPASDPIKEIAARLPHLAGTMRLGAPPRGFCAKGANGRDAAQVCTTLGMLTPEQALELRAAGLSAYNHNLDTSPEYYSKITSSRKYEVRRPAHATEATGGFPAR